MIMTMTVMMMMTLTMMMMMMMTTGTSWLTGLIAAFRWWLGTHTKSSQRPEESGFYHDCHQKYDVWEEPKVQFLASNIVIRCNHQNNGYFLWKWIFDPLIDNGYQKDGLPQISYDSSYTFDAFSYFDSHTELKMNEKKQNFHWKLQN